MLSVDLFRTLETYRATGHCAAVDARDGTVTLHGYRRYTTVGAIERMKHEMCPLEREKRVQAGLAAIRKPQGE